MNREISLLDENEPVDLDDDLESEYDIAALLDRARIEGREYRGILSGKGVRLAPDVAAVFSTSEAVNEALRTVIRVMRQEMKSAA
ncbi:MAG: hypothetical protein ACREEM_04585 [Blastocatellia bacterium]